MPPINITNSTATSLPSLISPTRNLKTDKTLVLPLTNPTSFVASSTATTAPVPSPVDSKSASSWSIPVVLGAILAILAILVGIPSALLAIKKLRNRRRANTSNKDKGTNEVLDNSTGGGNTGSNVTEGTCGSSINPNNTPSADPSIDPAQPLGNNLGEHRSSDALDTQFPPNSEDGLEMSSMGG